MGIQVNPENEICNRQNCSTAEYLVKDVMTNLIITFPWSLKIGEFLVQPGQGPWYQDYQQKWHLSSGDSLRLLQSVVSVDIRRGKCRLFEVAPGLLLSPWTQKALRKTQTQVVLAFHLSMLIDSEVGAHLCFFPLYPPKWKRMSSFSPDLNWL